MLSHLLNFLGPNKSQGSPHSIGGEIDFTSCWEKLQSFSKGHRCRWRGGEVGGILQSTCYIQPLKFLVFPPPRSEWENVTWSPGKNWEGP